MLCRCVCAWSCDSNVPMLPLHRAFLPLQLTAKLSTSEGQTISVQAVAWIRAIDLYCNTVHTYIHTVHIYLNCNTVYTYMHIRTYAAFIYIYNGCNMEANITVLRPMINIAAIRQAYCLLTLHVVSVMVQFK